MAQTQTRQLCGIFLNVTTFCLVNPIIINQDHLECVGKLVPLVGLGYSQLLPNIIHPDLAEVVSGCNVEAALCPGHSVQRSTSLHCYACTCNLGVLVQIPQVKPASAIHCCKESWVYR